MIAFAQTDVGRVREINEDSFLLPGEGERFCAVADGMGGHNAGEVASLLAIETFAAEMRKAEAISRAALGDIFARVNEAVMKYAMKSESLNGMGTTLTALVRKGDFAYIAHIGDSRCYRLRGGKIEQITTDHSLVQDLVDAGAMTPSAARVSPYRNIITQAIGTHWTIEPQLLRIEWLPGDVFFLCTDGLTEHVDPEDIEEVSAIDAPWPKRLDRLTRYALMDGGTDNITMVVAQRREDAQ